MILSHTTTISKFRIKRISTLWLFSHGIKNKFSWRMLPLPGILKRKRANYFKCSTLGKRKQAATHKGSELKAEHAVVTGLYGVPWPTNNKENRGRYRVLITETVLANLPRRNQPGQQAQEESGEGRNSVGGTRQETSCRRSRKKL